MEKKILFIIFYIVINNYTTAQSASESTNTFFHRQELFPFLGSSYSIYQTTPFPYKTITPEERLHTIMIRENECAIIGNDLKYKNAIIGPCAPCTAIIVKNFDTNTTLCIHKIAIKKPIFYLSIILDFLAGSSNCTIDLLTKELNANHSEYGFSKYHTQKDALLELKIFLLKELSLTEDKIETTLIPTVPIKILFHTVNSTFFIQSTTKGIIKFSTCYIQENIFLNIQKSDCFDENNNLNRIHFRKYLTKLESKIHRLWAADIIVPASDASLLSNLNPAA